MSHIPTCQLLLPGELWQKSKCGAQLKYNIISRISLEFTATSISNVFNYATGHQQV